MILPLFCLDAVIAVGTSYALLAGHIVIMQIFQFNLHITLGLVRATHVLITDYDDHTTSLEHLFKPDVLALVSAEDGRLPVLRALQDEAVFAEDVFFCILEHSKGYHLATAADAVPRHLIREQDVRRATGEVTVLQQ